ncbi:MAG: DUF6531 domain-containing protein, partial [Burkholderiaceae bacterium]
MPSGTLQFERYYNSSSAVSSTDLGISWRSNYDRSIGLSGGTGPSTAFVYRPEGKTYYFTLNNGAWTYDADIADKLVRLFDTSNNPTGWQYTVAADNSVERYDATGKLVSITSLAGLTQTLIYDVNGRLSFVTDNFGRQLKFTYDGMNRIGTMMDPSGGIYTYAYDANNNLSSVTYPDQKIRTYLYENNTPGVPLPHALTGIIDENNARFATWSYDAQKRAQSSQHALGVEKYSVTYNTNSSTVTDPLGTTRTYNLVTVLGVIKSSGQSQPGGAGCGAASNAITYDNNGNVASKTDFNNNKTTYIYNLARNLETSRTEASGTAQARTITTSWHATYRLPVAISEPLRKTTFNYDGSGNLLNKTVQATSDTNGSQGLSASTVGIPRTWSYTYNSVGQILTATGPRTDVVDKTIYGYDSATGNLLTITNAIGQVTTLSNYDANGRVGTIIDPNGMTATLSYYPRGWLHTKSVSNAGATQTTTYNY